MVGPRGPLHVEQEAVDEEVVCYPTAFPSRCHWYKLLWGLKSWILATENRVTRTRCLGLGYSAEKSCRGRYEVLLLVLLDVLYGAQSTRVLLIPDTFGECDISAEDHMKAAKLNMLPAAIVEF